MIHADPFHNYCVALVVAAHIKLESWASQQGIKYSDFSDLCQKPEAVKEVLGSLSKVCVFCSPVNICLLYCVGSPHIHTLLNAYSK